MDIIARELLSKLQKALGRDDVIVAGGAVRDHLLGGKMSDIDIFLVDDFPNNVGIKKEPDYNKIFPSRDILYPEHLDIRRLMPLIDTLKSIGCEVLDYTKGGEYRQALLRNSSGKFTVKYKDYDVDICLVTDQYFDDDKEFGENIVKEFNFGINCCYFDGSSIVEGDKFRIDRDHNKMTLQSLNSLDYLVHHHKKFLSINEKYNGRFWLDYNGLITLTPSDDGSKDQAKKELDFYHTNPVADHARDMMQRNVLVDHAPRMRVIDNGGVDIPRWDINIGDDNIVEDGDF